MKLVSYGGTVTEHNNCNNRPPGQFLEIQPLINFISFTLRFPQILLTLGDRLFFEWFESSVVVDKVDELCKQKWT
jgi:hypothetical protein